MDIEVLPSIPSNGDWVLKGQNGNPYWREDVKPDTDLSDKFVSLRGKDPGFPGQYAIGTDSVTRYDMKNPAFQVAYTWQNDITGEVFSVDYPKYMLTLGADVTQNGETTQYSNLSGILINPSNGISATINYNGQQFTIPQAPSGSYEPNMGACVWSKKNPLPSTWKLTAPTPGTRFYAPWGENEFKVVSVTDVGDGWLVIFNLYENLHSYGDVVTWAATGDDIWNDIILPNFAVVYDDIHHIGETYALGYHAQALGQDSVAIGMAAKALGGASLALGSSASAEGSGSVALGEYTRAVGEDSAAMGYRTIAGGRASIAVGRYNVQDNNKIFVVGYGSGNSSRKNIFTIDYNGKPDSAKIPSVNGGDLVMLGTASPTTKPAFAGQIYLDSTNKKLYVAKAATATTDWVPIN